ncbi:RagB/SusD family nutrient uptake outer membrane protein [Tamlana sp. 2201CG12-4]|uniref:RagB/SusD family nutrient uptake outer membrane protein n=1 Tax=Tamlana sp. 2201CG12-4 TaxID=3112582 RepID=UPI002DB6A7A6|nr:RagB/SusD family nutrient uptake outer membrane protein [Tamlana sp. 2201CG12-4]MEC3906907.1 RagB/SusD family nutrient uptake outer membrane protein [Tamlana sp. 2201CG12-4]
MKNFKYLFLFIILGTVFNCEEDFLDTAPARSISAEQVAETPAATAAIVSGIYANLRSFGIGNPARVDVDYGQKGIMAITDMMGQDIVLNNFNWYIFLYNYNGRAQTSSRTNIVWNTYYTAIADANSVINALSSNMDRSAEEDALLGQALAIRGFSLFNLVRVYAHTYIGNENEPGIPVPDRIDFDGKGRGTVQDTYDAIIPDLEEAVGLLNGFNRSSKQEIDQNVVHGFLANVYLETGQWQLAAENAASARAGYSLMPGDTYATDGFDDINNVEWMWGADIDNESSTTFISFFSHFDSSAGGYGGIGFGNGFKMMDGRLYDQIPDTDLRKAAWVDPNDATSPYPPYTNTKFIDATGTFEGDYSYMRAAEFYLVEAEAKARLGDATAADILFELVSNRDPAYVKSTSTGDALVEEIYLQRRIELWGEGVSWYDLKRLKKPLDRTGPGSTHKSFGLIDIEIEGDFFRMQIPQGELNSNPNIGVGDQNP